MGGSDMRLMDGLIQGRSYALLTCIITITTINST